MAIDAYTGLPGHGKSYGVVEHVVIPSLAEGRHVVTNIPLESDDLLADHGAPGAKITQLPPDWFERPDLADLIPAGAVAVLDELWRRWPAGLKSNNAYLSDKALLAEHRHRVDDAGRSMRIVLVTQDLAQVASWVRLLVEQTYRMSKLTAIGSRKKFRVDVFQGAATGQNPPRSRLIRQLYGQYKPKVYRYYSSATQSATGQVGDESTADKRANIFRSPVILFSFTAPVLLIPVLLWWLYGYFMTGFGMAEPPPVPQDDEAALLAMLPPMEPLPAPAAPSPQAAPPPPRPTQDSPQWRVAGSIQRAEPQAGAMSDMVLLASQLHGVRYVQADQCERMADGINWQCMIDGYRVTPWSGVPAVAHWSDADQLIGRTASVASGATNAGSGVRTVSPAAPSAPPES